MVSKSWIYRDGAEADYLRHLQPMHQLRALYEAEVAQSHELPVFAEPHYRRILVDWILDVSKDLGLLSLTVRRALLYMDIFFTHITDVPTNKLQLFALNCLFLSAKYEENDENQPSLVTMNHYTRNTYTRDEIQEGELIVLDVLKWRLDLITPEQFTHFFCMHMLSEQYPQSVVDTVDQEATRMLGIDFLYDPTTRFLPSIRAMACCLLSMQAQGHDLLSLQCTNGNPIHILPSWVNFEDVLQCMHVIINYARGPQRDPQMYWPANLSDVPVIAGLQVISA
eukprot:Clim_evm24s195 gene=Clim_evmTU24s195